jgi:hypothetical protein
LTTIFVGVDGCLDRRNRAQTVNSCWERQRIAISYTTFLFRGNGFSKVETPLEIRLDDDFV